MKKRKLKLFIVATLLCFALLFFVACSKNGVGKTGNTDPDIPDVPDPVIPDVPGDKQVDKVAEDTITVTETAEGPVLTWGAVAGAEKYGVTVNTYGKTAEECTLILSGWIPMPADGIFNITIVAQASGYKDSEPANKIYTAEGLQLQSPEIKSFDGGVLEWEPITGAKAYVLKVDGVAQSDGSDGYYRATEFDTAALADKTGKSFSVELGAVGDGAVLKDSDTVKFGVNKAHTKLTMLPISDYTVKDGKLSWGAVGNVLGYKIVDLDMNVVETTTATEYDMTRKTLVYGVYPVSASDAIDDAEIVETDIPYLDGKGTVGSPYKIRTPFDLRAVDYYEMKYAEALKTDSNAARKIYRLENDIDYAEVPAQDNESNIFTLRKPFYGTLIGSGKKLTGIRVAYDGGYWALFDFIVKEATVENITFVSPEITNVLQSKDHPLGAETAMVAYRNDGIINGIVITDAEFRAAGGEVSGVCLHNAGTVENCTVSGVFVQESTGLKGQACYEMAGVVLENLGGGRVNGCKIETLEVRGTACMGDSQYYNVRLVGGIVGVNRKGGIVTNNSYTALTLTNVHNYECEFGGIVGYSVESVSRGTGTLGTFKCNGSTVTNEGGTPDANKVSRGKLYGKIG